MEKGEFRGLTFNQKVSPHDPSWTVLDSRIINSESNLRDFNRQRYTIDPCPASLPSFRTTKEKIAVGGGVDACRLFMRTYYTTYKQQKNQELLYLI